MKLMAFSAKQKVINSLEIGSNGGWPDEKLLPSENELQLRSQSCSHSNSQSHPQLVGTVATKASPTGRSRDFFILIFHALHTKITDRIVRCLLSVRLLAVSDSFLHLQQLNLTDDENNIRWFRLGGGKPISA
jgi:hypothetical protein